MSFVPFMVFAGCFLLPCCNAINSVVYVVVVVVVFMPVCRETYPIFFDCLLTVTCLQRVATNLENLEYSGISLNTENSGNSQGILCNFRVKL